MPSIVARFSKYDQFKNAIFIVSDKEEKKSYERLTRYHRKLVDKDYGTFLPVFADEDNKFATIRFKRLNMNPTPRDTYQILFTIRKIEKDGKIYVNCFVDSIKRIKKSDPLDDGIVLEMSDSE